MMENSKGSKILFLGAQESPLLKWLVDSGETVIQTSERISPEFVQSANIEFLISFGYRHILRKNVLDLLPGRAINLHISYLPWNRGANPNFWSFVEDTPKGVTIHYLDEGVDTGDIIVQQKVKFNSARNTLATTYETLQSTIQDLFKENWLDIKSGNCKRQQQTGEGTTHKVKDMAPLEHLLVDGWNTDVSTLKDGYDHLPSS